MRHPYDADPWFDWNDPFRARRGRNAAAGVGPEPAVTRRAWRHERAEPDARDAYDRLDERQAPRTQPLVPAAARPPAAVTVPTSPRTTAAAPPPEAPAAATHDREADGDTERQRLRSALRELEATRARVERDAARAGDATRRGVVEQLLPVLDNLERSLAASVNSPDPSLRDGVRLVRDQFERVLEGYGLERMTSVGEAFDPMLHDAVTVQEVESDREGRVVAEWQPGYRLGDRVLRPAKVAVGKQRAAS